MITELYRFDEDGWWPRISNDGSKVCFGNLASRVFELATGKVWTPFPMRQSRWISTDVVTGTVEINPLAKKRFTRSAFGIQEHTEDSPSLVAGNHFDADEGHWLSNLSANRLVIDGKVFEGKYNSGQMRWPWVMATRNDAEIVWFFEGEEFFHLRLPAKANNLRLQDDGSVCSGYFWEVTESAPLGTSIDVTLTPWKRESPHVKLNEYRWCVTEGVRGMAIIGLREANRAIIIPGDCVDFDVKRDSLTGAFIVAGCDAVGRLRVYRVNPQPEDFQNLTEWGTLTSSPSSSTSKSSSRSSSASPSHTEEEMTEQEIRDKVSEQLAASRVPPDIAQGALIRFREEAAHERDKVGHDNISGGAQYFYFWPAYYAVIGSKLAKFGPPQGSPEQVFNIWAGWSGEGLEAAKQFYWNEQGKPDHLNPL